MVEMRRGQKLLLAATSFAVLSAAIAGKAYSTPTPSLRPAAGLSAITASVIPLPPARPQATPALSSLQSSQRPSGEDITHKPDPPSAPPTGAAPADAGPKGDDPVLASLPAPQVRAEGARANIPLPVIAPVQARPGIPLPPLRPADYRPSQLISPQDYFALQAGISALRRGDVDQALAQQASIQAPIAQLLLEWMYVRDAATHAGFSRIARFIRDNPDWPHQKTLRARVEVALYYNREDARTVLSVFAGSPPLSGPGKMALARAYLDTDNNKEAQRWIREAWINYTLSAGEERDVLATFGKLLSVADHKERLSRLLYRKQYSAARRIAQKLGKPWSALVDARAAAQRGARGAERLIAKLPANIKSDPIVLFSRIQLHRNKKQTALAAGLMLTAPKDPAFLGDVNQWWDERHDLIRAMLERSDFETAYRLAKDHSLKGGVGFAEAEFLAGWIALRFLNKPEDARQHFTALRRGVSTDISVARAEYWSARASEMLQDDAAAKQHYEAAASLSTTFYGQLAFVKLQKAASFAIDAAPEPTAELTALFDARPVVQAVKLLYELGETRLARSFVLELAYQLEHPEELVLAARLAQHYQQPWVALQVGKIAVGRARPLHQYAYLMDGVPRDEVSEIEGVEPALVYALVRQESSFNPAAISSAGARGLMQLMPATAREVASDLGEDRLNLSRLTDDPGFNAQLGGTYIAKLVESFDGSYIMAIAAYNAGGSRVRQWVRQAGDPRDPDIDPIDWLERIPFDETRNYVQRVMENLQIYRARLNANAHPLELADDLRRGAKTRTGAAN